MRKTNIFSVIASFQKSFTTKLSSKVKILLSTKMPNKQEEG